MGWDWNDKERIVALTQKNPYDRFEDGRPKVPDDILERMKKANPRFTWVDVEGAGHQVPVDKPQEFIAATRAFLGILT